jgi:hypothetical protein
MIEYWLNIFNLRNLLKLGAYLGQLGGLFSHLN